LTRRPYREPLNRSVVGAVCLAVGVAVLAGCRLSAESTVTVGADGSGTLAVGLSADEALLARAAEADVRPLADLAEQASALADRGSWTTEIERSEGRVRRISLSSEFSRPKALNSASTALSEGLATPWVAPLEPWRLTLTDDRARLEGGADLRLSDTRGDFGVGAGEAADRLRSHVEMRVAARLPGDVIATNGERGDGQRVM